MRAYDNDNENHKQQELLLLPLLVVSAKMTFPLLERRVKKNHRRKKIHKRWRFNALSSFDGNFLRNNRRKQQQSHLSLEQKNQRTQKCPKTMALCARDCVRWCASSDRYVHHTIPFIPINFTKHFGQCVCLFACVCASEDYVLNASESIQIHWLRAFALIRFSHRGTFTTQHSNRIHKLAI